jgi:hypothetical protein
MTAVALEFACLPVAVGAVREAVWLSLADAVVLWPRIRAEEALLDCLPGYREAFAGVPRVRTDARPAQSEPGEGAPVTLFTLVNSDTFRLFVGHLGWTIQEWREWLFQLLSRELFDREGRRQADTS